MKRKSFQNLFQIDDRFRSIATTMAGSIITAAFVGCSIIFTSVTLLSHTWSAVISHVTADDLSAVQTQVDDDGQTSENARDTLVPAFDDPGSLYQNLSPISNTHLPRIAVGIIVSSNRFSKSGAEPFTIALQLANITPHVLALSNVEPVKAFHHQLQMGRSYVSRSNLYVG